MDTALAEISEAVPFVIVDIFQLETRRGSATSTSANNLVDATNVQFLSGDTGKMVYNITDKTWAVIESFSSTSQVGLSKDIMASGEAYEIYNKGCWNHRQINIEDSGDFLWVIGAVYPAEPDAMFFGTQRNIRNLTLHNQNKIAEIDVAWVDNTKDADAAKDIYIYFAKQHRLNVMTDVAGTLAATAAVDVTSMSMTSLALAETIYKNQLFTVEVISGIDSRLTYRVSADVTLAGGGATVSFWPGLEAAIDNGAIVNFISSTLTPELERILIDLVTGQILMAEGISQVNQTPKGGQAVGKLTFNMGRTMLERARLQLKGLVDVDLRANHTYSRGMILTR